MTRIAVVGGYGAFGARLVERLAREDDLELIVAGRDGLQASSLVSRLEAAARARLAPAVIDAMNPDPRLLDSLGARVVINASGPFQRQDYALGRAAIAARCHYVDLADARTFVTGITALDSQAKAAGVEIVAGASTVPALSSAVLAAFEAQFAKLTSIEIGISPGNSFDPGKATTASILSYVGKPIEPARFAGAPRRYGWQRLGRHGMGTLGPRWMCDVDLPDLDLIPPLYPHLTNFETRAGLEVGLFHVGLYAISFLARAGILRQPEALAEPLLWIKRRLKFLGTETGGMYVRMAGESPSGRLHGIEWVLEAHNGHGPNIPTLAATVLAKRLAREGTRHPGARPAVRLVALGDLLAETNGLNITVANRVFTPGS